MTKFKIFNLHSFFRPILLPVSLMFLWHYPIQILKNAVLLLPHIIQFNSNINEHSKSQRSYPQVVERYSTIARNLGLNSYNEIILTLTLTVLINIGIKLNDMRQQQSIGPSMGNVERST